MITVLDENETEKSSEIKALRGSLSKYSNPQLIKKENEAWVKVARDKHGIR